MPAVTVGNVRIQYEEFGSAGNPAILLIMGYAAQMTVWPVSFCERLAQHSFRVIRFDNRDAGLSTHFDGVRAPGLARSLFSSLLNIKVKTPYPLDDMALDAAGLLDALNIGNAHIVGASMGGMIAQIIAARHRSRARSLTSVMSTSGNRRLPGPRPKVLRHVLFGHRKNMSDEQAIDYLVKFWGRVASPGYPTPESDRARLVTSWVERAFDSEADLRQFAAMAASGDRSDMLKRIGVPTLVIHGADDPLIPVNGGRHTAATIPNARLEIVPGMGHDLPESLVPVLAEMIVKHVTRVEEAIALHENDPAVAP